MTETETYLIRLKALRDRLRRSIDDEIEDVREALHKPGENTNLHTHNADMDVEGLDNAIGIEHALEHRLSMVEAMISDLKTGGSQWLANERERVEAYLATESEEE